MAKFRISKATTKGKTWKAVGENPVTGRKMVIQGGQAGIKVGKENPDSEASFDARHDATGMTPKKYINKLRWDDKAGIGTSVNIPDKLFKSKTKKAGATKSKSTGKSAIKKTATESTRTRSKA